MCISWPKYIYCQFARLIVSEVIPDVGNYVVRNVIFAKSCPLKGRTNIVTGDTREVWLLIGDIVVSYSGLHHVLNPTNALCCGVYSLVASFCIPAAVEGFLIWKS